MSRTDQRFVYRCLDAEGRLLYVGLTCNVTQRVTAHRNSWWGYLIATTTSVEHPTTQAARAAEREAIKNDSPRFNRQGRWATRATWTAEQYRDYYDTTRLGAFSGYQAGRMERTRLECLRRYGIDLLTETSKENVA